MKSRTDRFWVRAAAGRMIGILLLGLAGAVPAGGQIGFHSETIRIRVEADTVEVDGIYRFSVDPGARGPRTLFFPYPSDSLHGAARTVLLEEIRSGGERRPLEFRELGGNRGATWSLPPFDRDTLEIRTVYRQGLSGCSLRYIVTTTRIWKRPLARARFELRLPEDALEPEFSHPFRRGPDGVYRYEARMFLPDRDIEASWRCAGESGRIDRAGEGAGTRP